MTQVIHQNTNRKNLLQLLWLRLIAIIGQVATIFFVHYVLEIELPLSLMFGVVAALAVVSIFGFLRYESQKVISNRRLFFELLFDVFSLTVQLYLSGGIANPFISLFLLQVIISATLLEAFYAWIIAILTICCYIWLSFYHQTLHELSHHSDGDFLSLHLRGMLIGYVIAAVLLVAFITKIIRNLREGDQKINLLKQQSLERERMVRMGLFATSAAHEISTPLSTIAVIISDVKKMVKMQEVQKDLEIAESQIARCKKIISDILSSSKKPRSEEAHEVNPKNFFDSLIEEWRTSRKPQNLLYEFKENFQTKIVVDEILPQAFFNIFDNALEESPLYVEVKIEVLQDKIEVLVKDHGSGFSEKVIAKVGQPNFSTKGSSGLGLFLAINALRKFGGELKISNHQSGGAEVVIIIPHKTHD